MMKYKNSGSRAFKKAISPFGGKLPEILRKSRICFQQILDFRRAAMNFASGKIHCRKVPGKRNAQIPEIKKSEPKPLAGSFSSLFKIYSY
ncbi:hypothetical protein SIO70_31420 [Chitinophaga sancti]|uniref:hypothetical protein n=1 Tax=Chitinophaga sancti TaxID=1004 RepID=UPI002A747F7B|nr:hypothetical protein [Chitinophaga sancti]WPQ62874.1 hypothetical protein SIO70_31420 [Chitinophaga sancti]